MNHVEDVFKKEVRKLYTTSDTLNVQTARADSDKEILHIAAGTEFSEDFQVVGAEEVFRIFKLLVG